MAPREFKRGKEKILHNLLSSNLVSVRFQPLLKVLYFTSELSKRVRRSEVKLQVQLINGEQESLSTATSRI